MALGRVRSLLLGSPLRVAATVVVALVLAATVGLATGLLGAPSVVGLDNRFGDVNETATTVESNLTVSNPNPVGVRLGGTTVDYAIAMNGITMASGTKDGVAIESGNSTVHLTTFLRNDRIPAWWASHLRSGEHTTLTVHADVRSSLVGASVGAPTIERDVDTDVSSAFNSTETRPIDANQPLVSDPVLYLNETRGHWGNVTDAETPIEMSFTVYNPNAYPVTASSIGYDVTMNDVAVGDGSTARGVAIPPGESRTIEATTVIDNRRLDEWWVSHLERNQTTTLSIQFYARFDLSAVGAGTVRVPLDSVSHTFETDLFGNKAETSGGAGGESSTETGDATGSDGDRSDATATATEPRTDATETTDDGGLLGDETTASSGDDAPTGETPTETATAATTETATGGATTTDDGGLLP